MSYLHILNLVKAQDILEFRWCWAMEKIHGTSAHLGFKDGALFTFSGGASSEQFVKLFDAEKLKAGFLAIGQPEITVYGEAYGGKMQGMSATYGKELRFVAFEVKIGDCWLNVPQAAGIVESLGLEFVHYVQITAAMDMIDAQRKAPSEQAFRNGCANREDMTTWKPREGIVLRPPFEVTMNNGERVICKYKNEEFSERKSKADTDVTQVKVLADAELIADEWVTETRLGHVLDALGGDQAEEQVIPALLKAMVEDIEREAKGEIFESKAARRAIGTHTVNMFKQRLKLRREKQLDDK